MSTTVQSPTVHLLRRHWKPHKLRLNETAVGEATNTRMHRAFSWLACVEQMGDNVEYDLTIVAQWTAFNALYGQWDEARKEPVADRECWQVFIERVLELDSDGQIQAILQQHRPLAMTIFQDKYLSKYFWQDPDANQDYGRRGRFKAQGWYAEERWAYILEQLLSRIYLLRCQVVHGAATYGGRLNREALRHCSTMMGHLLRGLLVVIIDHGADEDWGIMCYPPVKSRKR